MKRPPRSRRGEAPSLSMPPLAAAGLQAGSLAWDPDSGAYLFRIDDLVYRVPAPPPSGETGADGVPDWPEAAAPGPEAVPAAEAARAEESRGGLLRIDGRLGEGPWQPLLVEAGMLLREGEGVVHPPEAAHERCRLLELRHSARGRALMLRYVEMFGERVLQRSVEIRLSGRALEIRVEAEGSPEPEGFCGFSLGCVGPEDAPRVPVTGLPERLAVLEPEGFAAGYADRFQGSAGSFPPGGAFSRPTPEGGTRPFSATFYVTLSRDPLGPLPSLPRPAAPRREAVERRVVLDYYSEQPYEEDDCLLRLLPLYGLQDVLLIYRNWQQYGYQRRGPLLYPADRSRGTNETFRRMVAAARAAGWLVALREEYASLAEDSPYWSEKAVARWWDGPPRLSRRPGTFAVAADRMLDFARLEATHIDRNYQPGAVFVDGHTAWCPEGGLRQVDDHAHPAAATGAAAARQVEGLAAFLREIHEGPIVGAAGDGPFRWDTLAEGIAEAVVRGPEGGRSAPLILDYELGEVRPRLLGLGAGSYRQFCGQPGDEPVDAGRVDWDAYRATEIALGHCGYVGNYRLRPGARGGPFPGGGAAGAVREYFLLRGLQELQCGAPVRSILYGHGEELLPLAEALRRGADLVDVRVRVEYGSGLTVYVNRSSRDAWRVETEEGLFELPPSGFVALAARQRFLAFTALVDGQRADFCRAADYLFADTRGAGVRRMDDLTLDGSAALLRSTVPGRQDVVMVSARQLDLGQDEYRLSERGDLRLAHVSTREVEVTVMDTESGKPVQVSWPAFTAAWRGGKLTVQERPVGTEAWQPSRCTVQPARGGVQLSRAQPGITYRVSAPA